MQEDSRHILGKKIQRLGITSLWLYIIDSSFLLNNEFKSDNGWLLKLLLETDNDK